MNIERVYGGFHQYLILDNLLAGVTTYPANGAPLRLIDAGALATGTYTCTVVTDGTSNVNVNLKCTFTTTGPTPSAYTVFLDGTADQTTAGSVMVGGTNQQLKVTSLTGKKKVVVSIVVPASSTATFSRAEAEGL